MLGSAGLGRAPRAACAQPTRSLHAARRWPGPRRAQPRSLLKAPAGSTYTVFDHEPSGGWGRAGHSDTSAFALHQCKAGVARLASGGRRLRRTWHGNHQQQHRRNLNTTVAMCEQPYGIAMLSVGGQDCAAATQRWQAHMPRCRAAIPPPPPPLRQHHCNRHNTVWHRDRNGDKRTITTATSGPARGMRSCHLSSRPPSVQSH